MWLDYEEDEGCWDIETQYAYGRDLLVAPVLEAKARVWPVYLPAGVRWVHLWSGERYAGGAEVTVDAPLGAPPVFHREDSGFADLFREVRRHFRSRVRDQADSALRTPQEICSQ